MFYHYKSVTILCSCDTEENKSELEKHYLYPFPKKGTLDILVSYLLLFKKSRDISFNEIIVSFGGKDMYYEVKARVKGRPCGY
jgi:hypothetical protein